MFLDVPNRPPKPRESGITCLIDPGLPVAAFRDAIESGAPYIDFVKFGWGTGAVTPGIAEKVAALRKRGIGFWFGGTLFELSHRQGRLDRMIAWVKELGGTHFEISDGTLPLQPEEKAKLIRDLSRDFTVLSEVGSKDKQIIQSPARWIENIRRELDAGAWRVIAEGRESGTAGIFRPSGEIREGLILEILECGIPAEKILFEAPQRVQQVWMIKTIGHNVNLANIPFSEVINLETLRLGLRYDTIVVPGVPPAGQG